jgi:hypothetical protein
MGAGPSAQFFNPALSRQFYSAPPREVVEVEAGGEEEGACGDGFSGEENPHREGDLFSMKNPLLSARRRARPPQAPEGGLASSNKDPPPLGAREVAPPPSPPAPAPAPAPPSRLGAALAARFLAPRPPLSSAAPTAPPGGARADAPPPTAWSTNPMLRHSAPPPPPPPEGAAAAGAHPPQFSNPTLDLWRVGLSPSGLRVFRNARTGSAAVEPPPAGAVVEVEAGVQWVVVVDARGERKFRRLGGDGSLVRALPWP